MNPYGLPNESARNTMRMPWSPHLLLAVLLAGMSLTSTAAARASFEVRITILSQCSAQQPLFGPHAPHSARVTCQPDMTPYQSHTTLIDATEEQQTQIGRELVGMDAPYHSTVFRPFRKEAFFPPLSSEFTSASRVFYLIF